MGNTELNLAVLLMNSSKPYCKKKFYRADRFYSSKYDEKITMPTVILLVNVVVSFTWKLYISITLKNGYFCVSSEWGMERVIQNINILAISCDNSSGQMLNF